MGMSAHLAIVRLRPLVAGVFLVALASQIGGSMETDPCAYRSLTELAAQCATQVHDHATGIGLPLNRSATAQGGRVFAALWRKQLKQLAKNSDQRLPAWPVLMADYPELARLICLAAQNWVDRRIGILDALERDAGLLRELGVPIKRIRAMEDMTTPTVPAGRTVMRIQLGDREVYYKPRDISAEAKFAEFISTVGSAIRIPIDTLWHQPRGNYGWVQAAVAAPVEKELGVDRFYLRMGVYLAIAHALGSSDLHGGNFVAVGHHPILVDSESLVMASIVDHNQLAGWEPGGPGMTVLETLLTPRVLPGRRRKADNNPQVLITGTLAASPISGCLPVWQGRPQPAYLHVPAIVAGFQRAAQWLAGEGMPAAESFLDSLSQLELRAMARSFSDEESAMEDAWRLPALKNASIRIQALVNSMRPTPLPVKADRAVLARFEVAALADHLHPRMTVKGDSTRIDQLGIRLTESPIERARASLFRARTTWQDQALLIKASLAPPRLILTKKSADDQPVLPIDRLRSWITQVAGQAWRSDDLIRWISASREPDRHVPTIQYTGSDLHDGASGIALTLAAASRALPAESAEARATGAAARSCFQSVRDKARAIVMRQRVAIGLDLGASGLAVAFALGHDLLGDSSYLEFAGECAHSVADPPPRHRGDLFGGLAGAALANLAVYHRTGDSSFLDSGAALIERALESGSLQRTDGSCSWQFSGRDDWGWAHGLAGVQLTLAAGLRAGIDHPQWRELLATMASATVAHFDAGRTRLGLCDGLAGATIATAAAADVFGGQLQAELTERACVYASQLATSDAGVDTLCCGNAGVLGALRFIESHCGFERESSESIVQPQASLMQGAVRLGTPHDVAQWAPSLWTGSGGPALGWAGEAGLALLAELVSAAAFPPVLARRDEVKVEIPAPAVNQSDASVHSAEKDRLHALRG